jgi:hypothetical protein
MAKLEALPVEDVGEVSALLKEIWTSPKLRRIFKVGMGLQFLQQFSGINTMMYYGATVLVMCGFPKQQSLEMSFLLAVAQVLIVLECVLIMFTEILRATFLVERCVLNSTCVINNFKLKSHTLFLSLFLSHHTRMQ